MEDKKLSKPERYNNPGALRPFKVIYEGQVDVDPDGFAIFETSEAGRRALIKQIETQIKRGENTVDTFLNRYAPPGKENPPANRDNYRVALAEHLGLKSTDQPFPEGSTERIADAITKFESGSAWGKPPAASQESDAKETVSQPTLGEKFSQLGEDAKNLALKTVEEYPTTTRVVSDLIGAEAGRRLNVAGEMGRRRFVLEKSRMQAADRAAARAAEQAARQAAQNVEVLPATSRPPGPVSVPGAGAAPPPGPVAAGPNVPVGPADAGRMAPGQTGQMVYNYGKAAGLTDIEAARALDMTKQTGGVHDLSTGRREGLQRVQSMFPGERYVENPRFGGLMTPDSGAGGGPRASYVMNQPPQSSATPLGGPPQQPTLRALPPPERIPNAPIEPPLQAQPSAPSGPSALSQAAKNVSQNVNAGVRAFPGVAGFLGGLGTVDLGQEAYSRFSKGDAPGGFLAAAGSGASALSLFPFPATKVPSTFLAIASPLALYAYDKLKNRAVSQAKGYGSLLAGAELPAPSIYSGYSNP